AHRDLLSFPTRRSSDLVPHLGRPRPAARGKVVFLVEFGEIDRVQAHGAAPCACAAFGARATHRSNQACSAGRDTGSSAPARPVKRRQSSARLAETSVTTGMPALIRASISFTNPPPAASARP